MSALHVLEKLEKKEKKNLTAPGGEERSLLYGESLAFSLLYYADKEPHFAAKLREIFREVRTEDTDDSPIVLNERTAILMPRDGERALHRARWLKDAIAEERVPGSLRAAHLLHGWLGDKPYEAPKQVVVGMVVVAIPGITLGRLSRKVTMGVIVRSDLAAPQSPLALSEEVAHASLQILSESLRTAGGNARKLEPEVADWFFGEKALAFYGADEETLADVERELTTLGVPYARCERNGETALLGLSPAIEEECAHLYWGLTPLNAHE